MSTQALTGPVRRSTPAGPAPAAGKRSPPWRRIVGIPLSATGLAETLCFGGWALGDRLRPLPNVATT